MLLPEFCEELFYTSKKIKLFEGSFKNYLQKVYDYSFLETQSFFKELNKNYTIEQLKKLRYLNLSYCGLKTIINLNLPSLHILYICVNELIKIPDFTYLPNLQKLSFTNNNLTKIPKLNLPNLQRLYLDNNRLTSIPELALNFPNLVELHLDNNQLKEFSTLSLLPKLYYLYLDNNQVKKILNFSNFRFKIIVI